MELRQQGRLDAFAGFVVGPQLVAERLDHVIGGDADVRRAGLEHLRDGAEHAGDRAERAVAFLFRAPVAVEMAEQLVRAVDEMNDHRAGRAQAAARSSSSARSRALRVSDAARSNSARASSGRPSLLRKSPRTAGSR